jgi:hypothetical protein
VVVVLLTCCVTYCSGYEPYSREGLVWLFAKMHAASADAQVHEMVGHLLLTHLAMEPVLGTDNIPTLLLTYLYMCLTFW